MWPETRPRINITSRLTRGAPRVRAGSYCRAHSRGPSPGIARPGQRRSAKPYSAARGQQPCHEAEHRSCAHMPPLLTCNAVGLLQPPMRWSTDATDRPTGLIRARVQDALDVSYLPLSFTGRYSRKRLRHHPALRFPHSLPGWTVGPVKNSTT